MYKNLFPCKLLFRFRCRLCGFLFLSPTFSGMIDKCIKRSMLTEKIMITPIIREITAIKNTITLRNPSIRKVINLYKNLSQ